VTEAGRTVVTLGGVERLRPPERVGVPAPLRRRRWPWCADRANPWCGRRPGNEGNAAVGQRTAVAEFSRHKMGSSWLSTVRGDTRAEIIL